MQDVQTGHYADAIDDAQDTAKALVALSVEAGYGYALLALCFKQCAAHDPSLDDAQRAEYHRQAQQYWGQATLLIPPAALVYRFGELQVLTQPDKD